MSDFGLTNPQESLLDHPVRSSEHRIRGSQEGQVAPPLH